MSQFPAIRTAAVLGAGTIGMSWAALFLARGLTVRLQDLDPGAEARTRDYVARAWPDLQRLSLAPDADPERLSFHAEPAEAVAGAELVQENLPERLPVKLELFRRIESALEPGALVCTSTSGLLLSDMQQGWRDPAPLVLAHPFNPPHLIPLVELYANERTAPAALDRAETFYRGLGKVTIRLNKEVPGHVANRLQAAVIREALHLLAEGVASVGDIDTAMTAGPGIRWAIIGPLMANNLAVGDAGIATFWQRYLPAFEVWWASLGQPRVTPELVERLRQGLGEAIAGRSFAELAAERDKGVMAILTRET